MREASNWKPHLEATKKFILEAASKKNKSSVAVLGSGWLLDVPLETLSTIFNEVHLYDIRHPKSIKNRVKKLGNVTCIVADISGFATSIYTMVQTRKKFALSEIEPQNTIDLTRYDFVISCNLMDQLDTILIDYLQSHMQLSEIDVLCVRTKIQETHLNLLPKEKSCLITDLEEWQVGKNDRIRLKKLLIFATLPNRSHTEWIWHFDNLGSYNPGLQTWFRVVGMEL